MRSDIDLKNLWNKGGSNEVPDVKDLFKKAGNLRKAARIRLIIQSVVLLISTGIMLVVGLNINNRQLTTTIGAWLMIMAMVIYLVVANELLPMLFKSDIGMSNKEFLDQLIRIKRKNEFLDRVLVHIYFSLLIIGMLLYLLQFFKDLSILKAIFCSIVFICLAVAWYYSKNRESKKMQSMMNQTIKHLQTVNEQLQDGN